METTPGLEVPGSKRLKQSGSNGEVQDIPVVVIVDSLERGSGAFLALEGAA